MMISVSLKLKDIVEDYGDLDVSCVTIGVINQLCFNKKNALEFQLKEIDDTYINKAKVEQYEAIVNYYIRLYEKIELRVKQFYVIESIKKHATDNALQVLDLDIFYSNDSVLIKLGYSYG